MDMLKTEDPWCRIVRYRPQEDTQTPQEWLNGCTFVAREFMVAPKGHTYEGQRLYKVYTLVGRMSQSLSRCRVLIPEQDVQFLLSPWANSELEMLAAFKRITEERWPLPSGGLASPTTETRA